MMSFDLPQIPVQETGIVVLAQAAVTKKRLKNEPGPFDAPLMPMLRACLQPSNLSLPETNS